MILNLAGALQKVHSLKRIGDRATHGQKTMVAQDAGEQVDVGEVRHVLEGQPVRRQQARDHQRQGGVLGA